MIIHEQCVKHFVAPLSVLIFKNVRKVKTLRSAILDAKQHAFSLLVACLSENPWTIRG